MALDYLWHDVRFAVRQFGRRPGLTLAALVALGCGLGAVTTVFTLVDAVILRSLPVAKPGELVAMRNPSFSFPVFEEVSARADMLSSVFAWTPQRLQAQWTSEPESHARTARHRRDVRDSRTASRGRASPRAIRLWSIRCRRAARRRPELPGLAETVRRRPLGHWPDRTDRRHGLHDRRRDAARFFGVAVGVPVDVTIPLTILPRLRADEREALTAPGNSWLNIMGRLRPGTRSPLPMPRSRRSGHRS